jgi:hypothetical protein
VLYNAILPLTASDFTEAVTNVTFRPFENSSCAEVQIIDDITQESSEQFSVGFSGPPMPGVERGTVTSSTVTIIDNDDPAEGTVSTAPSMEGRRGGGGRIRNPSPGKTPNERGRGEGQEE